MDLKNFRAGKYTQQFQYKSFSPNPVDILWEISDSSLIHLLSQADIKLGELNAFSQLVPDIDFFIKMHISKEATTSSRIEGTQTNIAEVLQKEEYIAPEKRNDWNEVHNYIIAMNEAISDLQALPLSSRIFKTTHQALLKGVREEQKMPGEFRESQNWIGGASINDAFYIPPHFKEVPELISDLEKFINNETSVIPHLIKIGIAHYQFETIHPFLDGNGRIGRLLITLYLMSKGLLIKPTLYLSAYFEKHKSLYYDNLTRVRTHNDLTQWLKFFLVGIKQTSENSIQTFKEIIKLRQEIEQHAILTLGKKTKLAQKFINYLYSNPFIDGQSVASALEINSSTAFRLIGDFERLNILQEETGFKRNRFFSFRRYIQLFEG